MKKNISRETSAAPKLTNAEVAKLFHETATRFAEKDLEFILIVSAPDQDNCYIAFQVPDVPTFLQLTYYSFQKVAKEINTELSKVMKAFVKGVTTITETKRPKFNSHQKKYQWKEEWGR